MVIVGVDPGSLCTGYGVIAAENARIRWLDAGVIKAPRSKELSVRLLKLHDGLLGVVQRWSPDAIAMEECFMGRYARAALVLGHARGALMIAALTERVPLFEYAPRLVKMASTGAGSASKEQVQAMVPHLIEGAPQGLLPDEADALAVAVCHVHRMVPVTHIAAVGEVLR
ncbi:MAG: crossover junction endodeoxyribonuclease RuvC [Candidatus Eisenbacteria sp.]|nr:crossover junction endodeoxyribonuclease RuvC [Candidatus Eisenbacteria bacterium]